MPSCFEGASLTTTRSCRSQITEPNIVSSSMRHHVLPGRRGGYFVEADDARGSRRRQPPRSFTVPLLFVRVVVVVVVVVETNHFANSRALFARAGQRTVAAAAGGGGSVRRGSGRTPMEDPADCHGRTTCSWSTGAEAGVHVANSQLDRVSSVSMNAPEFSRLCGSAIIQTSDVSH